MAQHHENKTNKNLEFDIARKSHEIISIKVSEKKTPSTRHRPNGTPPPSSQP
jgi:hypothetical protein